MKGGKPVLVDLRDTRHGPVLYQDNERQCAIALKWVVREPGTAGYLGSLAVCQAHNKAEFLQALKSWKTPSENFMYADVDGHIGWVAAVLTPVRKGWDGLLPVPGQEGKYEWQGFLSVQELPQRFDPPTHFLATANHNILPPGYPHFIGLEWSAPYRYQQVKSRLEGNHQFTLAEFRDLQYDNHSRPGLILARVEPGGVAGKTAASGETVGAVERRAACESLAGPLYALWLQELQEEFYRPHIPARSVEGVRRLSGLPVLLTALTRADPAWFGKDAVKHARCAGPADVCDGRGAAGKNVGGGPAAELGPVASGHVPPSAGRSGLAVSAGVQPWPSRPAR